MIADYLLRNLCFESAKVLLIGNGLGLLSSFDVYHHEKPVFEALKTRDLSVLIKWCRRNKTILKEHDVLLPSLSLSLSLSLFSTLFFGVRRVRRARWSIFCVRNG